MGVVIGGRKVFRGDMDLLIIQLHGKTRTQAMDITKRRAELLGMTPTALRKAHAKSMYLGVESLPVKKSLWGDEQEAFFQLNMDTMSLAAIADHYEGWRASSAS